ncbi:MAG: hypothetical protein HYX88_02285 [Chloroflexi bacterium]|nr:hypothetical protein [Chloroflexota bacterium]
MESVSIGRTIYDKQSGFQRVGLNMQEEADVLQAIRDAHIKTMRECFEDAQVVLGRTAPSNLVRIACALFERRATASYTVFQEFLARKVHELKNGNGNGGNHG